jgi:hypothetical protein
MSLKDLFEIDTIESRLLDLYQNPNLNTTEVEQLKSEVLELASEVVKKYFTLLEKYENNLNSKTNEPESPIPENHADEARLEEAVSPTLSKKQPFLLNKNAESSSSQKLQPDIINGQSKDENDSQSSQVEERENRISSTSDRKKSGGFGIKSMLSSLTKGRPKPKRSGEVYAHNALINNHE